MCVLTGTSTQGALHTHTHTHTGPCTHSDVHARVARGSACSACQATKSTRSQDWEDLQVSPLSMRKRRQSARYFQSKHDAPADCAPPPGHLSPRPREPPRPF